MEDDSLGDESPQPPARLLARLASVAGYTWDHSFTPFHSSYDHWHVYGLRHTQESDQYHTPTSSILVGTPSTSARSDSSRSSPKLDPRPGFRHHWSSLSEASTGSEISSSRSEPEILWTPVVARISVHMLRLEREYNGNKKLIEAFDPECDHTIRPYDIFRLPAIPGDTIPMIVTIYESPGRNHLRDLINFGPAFYGLKCRSKNADDTPSEQIQVQSFLDFAIGACECLELIHHGFKTVHGEVRPDAFHWSREKNVVKIVNGGNGPRSFENLLSSEGWASLSQEVGIKNKLQFVAPEQTGRLPTDPDTRTDIYSLGVLFWVLLTTKPAFDADSPIDIIQKVLSSRLPAVSSIRLDIPDAISHIIARMTQKQMDERYKSISGLKYDLVQIAKLLGEGDQEAIRNYKVGTKDVSAFFLLPTKTFGRHTENERIFKIIDKVLKRQQSAMGRAHTHAIYSTTSNSSISESRIDNFDLADGSESSSSQGVKDSRSNSTTVGLEMSAWGSKMSLVSMLGRNIAEPRPTNSWDFSDRESQLSGGPSSGLHDGFSRRGTNPKSKKRGRCELITLLGPQGVGKTHLIRSVQPTIRRHGYFALARFDRARPTPFEPLIKVMASLFRQIFSEKDVNTPYHELIRSHVRPIWGVLHTILDLPDSLIDSSVPSKRVLLGNESISRSNRTEIPSIETVTTSNPSGPRLQRDSNDFLRGPASTKSIRFINTYLDVFRAMCVGKVICMCLDDLQSADDESVDLLLNIIKAKIPAVVILTSRFEDGKLPDQTKRILDVDSTNKIDLANLRERHVFEYVAATMSQEVDAIIPLAAVVNEKSGGNPFLIKEILQTCYQKDCLWYDWKVFGWQYDLDRVFNEFASEQHGCLTSQFITNRLQELSPASRSILAWASLIGNSFSFSMIQKLLRGDNLFSSGRDQANDVTCPKRAKLFNLSESDCVDGLQDLLNRYILIPGESDDEFKFANARYLRAANDMRECHNTKKMHFILAQTMIKYLSKSEHQLYPLARHICLSAEIVKQRISQRVLHRDILWRGAKRAAESGAASTALWYYKVAIQLLQDDPWDDSKKDVIYNETLQLYVHTAELYYSQGEDDAAMDLLTDTFVYCKSSADKVRSWILWGKIYSKKGDFDGAFNALKCSLAELGMPLPRTTWDECDLEFKKLEYRLRDMDRSELLTRPLSEDPSIIALGTIMSEALAAVYWADSLLYYQLIIEFIKVHLDQGSFIQAAIGYVTMSMAAVTRFKDVELAMFFSGISQDLLTIHDDPWTRGRGWVLYAIFIGHFQTPIRNTLPILESALDYSLMSGDNVVCIMNIGAMAIFRFWAGQDVAEVEAFCNYAPDEIEGWENDLRGGTLLITTKQLCRALQGKTRIQNAETTLDDDNFQQAHWLSVITSRTPNPDRPRDIYKSVTLMAYYLYGHYDYVVKVGRWLVSGSLEALWTNRPVACARFYLGLALVAKARELPEDQRAEIIQEIKDQKKYLDVWASHNDVNYAAWVHMLAAEIADLTYDWKNVMSQWEMTIDHCQVHGFALDEALAVELQAEYILRKGAKRAGKVMIQEAIAAWNRINAIGKAKHLAEKHEWLLKTATTARTMDVGVQTMDTTAFVGSEDPDMQNKRDYTRSWVEPKAVSPQTTQDVPGLGLDILDLTSILEFSRIISSELQINSLLSKMTSVILESVGGQAEFCAIVINSEENGWCVAASGDHENGVKTHDDGIPFGEVDDQVAQQITHYIIRTKETVFLDNVLEDERFSNVSEPYLTRNPKGRAIIAIPIVQADHLIGVIHLEGRPNAFTQRNMVVLNLLTTQVSISLGNALLYRKVRKVSAANASMVESQKRALAQARDAEAKAKKAEAEAMHNVKLKEEAAKAKSIFLANVSHELRTPLNGVIGMSELLKGTPLSKDQEGYADSIRVCADTLLTVINDILDFSKLEAGKMQMFTVPVNLKETITEVVRALAYTNQEHGLETIEDLTLDDSLVLGDPVRLHQIFMNLLSNSYKFTPKGSVTVKARKISETKNSVRITCSVADTGIGITQEQLTRLFQPFSQADSSTARSYGGSGLGLSICKAMIENVLGGKIWIESTPGVGTTVFFTLSFQKAPKDSSVPSDMKITAKDPDPMANWSKSTSPDSEKRVSFCDLSKVPRDQLRVCIAEDNVINRKIAIGFVKKLGLIPEAFEDGKLAYEALQRASKAGNPFHLVLMDVQMPVLDGYEATKAIRQDSDRNVREVLIIAMTASAIRGDREKCLEAGMNDYLAKPVRQTVLKSMLDDYLNNNKTLISENGESVIPGDKANGVVPDSKKESPENAPNGEAKPPKSSPTKRKSPAIKRRKSKEDGKLEESTNRSPSPPSGIIETEVTGRVTSEIFSPKISMKIPLRQSTTSEQLAVNGEGGETRPNGEKKGGVTQ